MNPSDAETATAEQADQLYGNVGCDLRDDLGIYVTKNIGEYQKLIDIYAEETEENPVGFKISFTLTGLFFPFVWLIYRKMYLSGFLALALYMLNKLLELGLTLPLIIGLLTAFTGKTFYIRSAVKNIRDIKSSTPNSDEARVQIQKAGGTSFLGTVLGVIYIGSFFAIILIIGITLIFPQ